MLYIKSYNAAYKDKYTIELNWEFEPDPVGINGYYIQVLGGEDSEHLTSLTPPTLGLDYFVHTFDKPKEYYQAWYYKIIWTDKNNPNKSGNTDIFKTGIPPDPIALELASKVELVLRTMSGIKCKIYKRKTAGRHCSCWDETRARSLDPDCHICKGTGIVDGYYPPYTKYVNILETDRNDSLSTPGHIGETYTAVISAGPNPKFTIRDLVLEPSNGKIWRIVKEAGPIIDKKRYQTRQKWMAKLVDKDSIKYIDIIN